jgi:hypothetical protein
MCKWIRLYKAYIHLAFRLQNNRSFLGELSILVSTKYNHEPGFLKIVMVCSESLLFGTTMYSIHIVGLSFARTNIFEPGSVST